MKLNIKVDGQLFEVEVEVDEPESPRPAYVPPPGHVRAPAAAATPAVPLPGGSQEVVADESKVCRSPISGVVVRVTAKVGDAIAASDVLLVVEAMKMETEITSPREGKVSNIKVTPGDSVKTGQVLVEFE